MNTKMQPTITEHQRVEVGGGGGGGCGGGGGRRGGRSESTAV